MSKGVRGKEGGNQYGILSPTNVPFPKVHVGEMHHVQGCKSKRNRTKKRQKEVSKKRITSVNRVRVC